MKSALLVGIPQYPGMRPMPGCAHDVDDVAALLRDVCRFDPGRIIKLEYPETLGSRIKARLRTAITELHGGDELVFFFSGHGVKYPLHGIDHDGLCGFDFTWDNSASVFIDDDLSQALSGLAENARVTIIVDACYSGGLHPNYAYLLAIAAAPSFRIRTYPVPADVEVEIARLDSLQQSRTFADAIVPEHGPTDRDVVLLSACSADEVAADHDFENGRSNGVLTYALVHRLTAVRCNGESATSTLTGIRAAVAQLGMPQTPELHGAPLTIPLLP